MFRRHREILSSARASGVSQSGSCALHGIVIITEMLLDLERSTCKDTLRHVSMPELISHLNTELPVYKEDLIRVYM